MNMGNNIIEHLENMFTIGNSVQITYFAITNRGIYERGDTKCCILL